MIDDQKKYCIRNCHVAVIASMYMAFRKRENPMA
jgi:hypothetical protein